MESSRLPFSTAVAHTWTAAQTINLSGLTPAITAFTGTYLRGVGATGAAQFQSIEGYGGTPNLALTHAAGTAAAPTATQSASVIARHRFYGYGATGRVEVAQFRFEASQNYTDSVAGVSMSILTTPTGSATLGSRLGISATGDITVDNTTASTSTTTGALIVAGGIGCAGAIYAGGASRIGSSGSTGVLELFSSSNVVSSLKLYTSSTLRSEIQGDNTGTRLVTNSATIWESNAAGTLLTVSVDTTFADAKNLALGTTTGTKIGTATTQKIGFYNATPIVQGASVADATGGATVDAEARTAINALISRIEALGLIATV